MPGRCRPHCGQAAGTAQGALAQLRGALVEEDRVDPLHPGGVLAAQVVVCLQQRPALQDPGERDPALGQPPPGQQLPQVPGIGPVSLGVPLAAAGERGIGRLGDVCRDPGGGHLLRDVPPSGAPLHGERDVITAGEPGQPAAQVLPVRRADLAAGDLPVAGVEVVEGQLLLVDIQPAYDGHRDLLKLPGRHQAPERELLRLNRHASELRRSRHAKATAPCISPAANGRTADACHLRTAGAGVASMASLNRRTAAGRVATMAAWHRRGGRSRIWRWAA